MSIQTKIRATKDLTQDQLKQLFKIGQEIGKNDSALNTKRWNEFPAMKGLVDTPSSPSMAEFTKHEKASDAVLIFKELDGEIISSVGVVKWVNTGLLNYYPWDTVPAFCTLTDVWTHPKHRGHGYSFDLIEKAAEFAKSEWKKRYMLLVATILNIPAISLYKKSGFQEYAAWMAGIPNRELWKDTDYTFYSVNDTQVIKHDPYCKQTFKQQFKYDQKKCEIVKELAPSENAALAKLCKVIDNVNKKGAGYRATFESEGRFLAIHRNSSFYPFIYHLSTYSNSKLQGIASLLSFFSKIFDISRTELENEHNFGKNQLTCLWYPTYDLSRHAMNDAMYHGFISSSVSMFRSL